MISKPKVESANPTPSLCLRCKRRTLRIHVSFIPENDREYLLELDLDCQSCGYKETKQFKLVLGTVGQNEITPVAMNIPEMRNSDLEDYLGDLVRIVQKMYPILVDLWRTHYDTDLELSIEIIYVAESQEIARIRQEIAEREMRAKAIGKFQVV